MNKTFLATAAAIVTILGFFLALAEFMQNKGENKTEITQQISGTGTGNIHIENNK